MAMEGLECRFEFGKNIRRYGVVSSARLVSRLKYLADQCIEELERRLDHHPEKLSAKELGVVMGIATDKIAKRERWGVGDEAPTEGESPLARLCRAASEGRIDLSIQVKAAPVTLEERLAIGAERVLEVEALPLPLPDPDPVAEP
jgi:hypothetical protein